MGTHLRVLSKRSPMNANMTGFVIFSKPFVSLWLGQNFTKVASALERLKLKDIILTRTEHQEMDMENTVCERLIVCLESEYTYIGCGFHKGSLSIGTVKIKGHYPDPNRTSRNGYGKYSL